MPIHFLTPSAYQGPVSLGAFGGQSAATHVGWLRLPDGALIQAFVKAYGPRAGLETRELVNEFIGHNLAAAWSLPTPEHAGIVTIERRHFRGLPLWSRLPARATHAICWWTSRSPLHSIKARFNLEALESRHALLHAQVTRIVQELLAAPSIPATVAFDEITANIDRNLGNLLGPDSAGYQLIDHGMLLTGACWQPAHLQPDGVFTNKLCALLGGAATLPFRSAVVNAVDQFQGKLAPSLQRLRDQLAGALTDAEIDSVVAFVAARARRDVAVKTMGLIA